jgi:2,3-bisphosphoglycerate-dependent phosphoglycerate mutase
MEFYFIRHGQSTNNLLWQRTGSTNGRSEDPKLTETGQQQVRLLAQFLRHTPPNAAAANRDTQNIGGFGITHLYTSLMVRAVATGTAVADALGLPLTAWQDLHEGGGIFLDDEATGERNGRPGKNRAFFAAHYPDLILPDSLDDIGWWNRPYEEHEERPARAKRVLRELLERHGATDDRVAVVSHGGFYNYFLWELLGLPQREGFWFALSNTGITRVDFDGDNVGLVYSNRTDFLPKELVT